jgi:heme/copper-type cytochrome/quinol oxidase subunit 3
MESSAASAPLHPKIEPEPPGWQPGALWLNARLLCGSITFFFLAFVFAYFYLRSLDPDHGWKIGAHVSPSIGLGTAVMVLLVASAAVFRLGRGRPSRTLLTTVAALVLGLVAVALQCILYTTLGFGPASGAYASVYTGWTATYTLLALISLIGVEIQAATLWRTRREGVTRAVREGVPAYDEALIQAGIEGYSFYWAYYAALGFLAWVILYLV